MKKEYVLWLILLVILTALNCSLFIFLKRNIIQKHDVQLFSLNRNIQQLEDALTIHFKINTFKTDFTIVLADSSRRRTRIDSLFLDGKKLCFKFSQHACEDCLSASLRFLKQFNYMFLKTNVIVITDFIDKEGLAEKKREMNIPSPFYVLEQPLFEDPIFENSTLFFVVDSDKILAPFVISAPTIKLFKDYYNYLHENKIVATNNLIDYKHALDQKKIANDNASDKEMDMLIIVDGERNILKRSVFLEKFDRTSIIKIEIINKPTQKDIINYGEDAVNGIMIIETRNKKEK